MAKEPKETSLSAFNKSSLKNTTDGGIGCSTTRAHDLVYKLYSLGKSKGIKVKYIVHIKITTHIFQPQSKSATF